MLPEISSGPKHCNPYPKTQWRFWKNNKRTSEYSPRLLGQTNAAIPREIMRRQQADRPGWQTFNRWTSPLFAFLKKMWLVSVPENRFSVFFWSTLARFRVASNTPHLPGAQSPPKSLKLRRAQSRYHIATYLLVCLDFKFPFLFPISNNGNFAV